MEPQRSEKTSSVSWPAISATVGMLALVLSVIVASSNGCRSARVAAQEVEMKEHGLRIQSLEGAVQDFDAKLDDRLNQLEKRLDRMESKIDRLSEGRHR